MILKVKIITKISWKNKKNLIKTIKYKFFDILYIFFLFSAHHTTFNA